MAEIIIFIIIALIREIQSDVCALMSIIFVKEHHKQWELVRQWVAMSEAEKGIPVLDVSERSMYIQQ